jgi:hypothetical protein
MNMNILANWLSHSSSNLKRSKRKRKMLHSKQKPSLNPSQAFIFDHWLVQSVLQNLDSVGVTETEALAK